MGDHAVKPRGKTRTRPDPPRVPSGPSNRVWGTVQTAGLLATVALLAGLVLRPEPSLNLLWNIVIPLVPASLLISPLLWRNACPLATLNMLSNGRRRRRVQQRRLAAGTATLGIALLFVLVPARRFLLNADGAALAATIAAVAGLAILVGATYDMKAGFCNAFCPVLPVERLYGQAPMLRLSNQRCGGCNACSVACIDTSPERSVPQMLGTRRNSANWLLTPLGVFAALFPGFVLGYFTTSDGPLSAAGLVYEHIAGWALFSASLLLAAAVAFRLSSAVLLPAAAGLAAGLYYWFAAPAWADAVGLGAAAGMILQAAAMLLVAIWLWRAWRAASRANGSSVVNISQRRARPA